MSKIDIVPKVLALIHNEVKLSLTYIDLNCFNSVLEDPL